MKKRFLILSVALGLAACQHRDEPNKLIDGIPVNVSASVVPVQATQEFLLLNRDLLTVTIPVINKLANADSTFNELTPLGGGTYRFVASDAHYGSATFDLNFQEITGAPVDPIAVRTSSNAVGQIIVDVSGRSPLFSYTESLTLRLSTAGVLDSERFLSGTASFTGVNDAAGYSLSYAMTNATAIFQGLFAGQATATGSGGTPAQPTTQTIYFATNRNADGTVTWEGQEGTFHVDVSGPAYVVTGANRIFID